MYNSGSGHTHVLDPVTALIIQQISEHDSDTKELIHQVRMLLVIEPTEESELKLKQTLSQLEELGLIESVTT